MTIAEPALTGVNPFPVALYTLCPLYLIVNTRTRGFHRPVESKIYAILKHRASGV
jgi:hypothetical protein